MDKLNKQFEIIKDNLRKLWGIDEKIGKTNDEDYKGNFVRLNKKLSKSLFLNNMAIPLNNGNPIRNWEEWDRDFPNFYKDCGERKHTATEPGYVVIRLIPKGFIAVGLHIGQDGYIKYPEVLVNKDLILSDNNLEIMQRDIQAKARRLAHVESSIRATQITVTGDIKRAQNHFKTAEQNLLSISASITKLNMETKGGFNITKRKKKGKKNTKNKRKDKGKDKKERKKEYTNKRKSFKKTKRRRH